MIVNVTILVVVGWVTLLNAFRLARTMPLREREGSPFYWVGVLATYMQATVAIVSFWLAARTVLAE